MILFQLSQFENGTFRSLRLTARFLRQAQISIFEILNTWMFIPLYLSGVVEIIAFLELE